VDLIDSTAAHVHLQGLLGVPTPAYWHLPVVVNAQGQKLSKQTGAASVHVGDSKIAVLALELLGLTVPAELTAEPPRVLWRWAQNRWRIESLRGRRAVTEPRRE